MGLFGKTETEWGVRFGGKDKWGYASKKDAENACKRMNKNVGSSGTKAKVIQRTKRLTAIRGREKDKCSGGKCKGPYTCRKHAKRISGSDYELYDSKGRNKNNVRWDEK
jgi:hypothetical protein